MNTSKFSCIHCGQKLSCDLALAGKQISCPLCSRSLVVPWAPVPDPSAQSPQGVNATVQTTFADGWTEAQRIAIPELTVAPPELSSSSRLLPKVVPPPLASTAPEPPEISSLAAIAFALSLLGPVGFLPAILCGHLAKWRIRHRSNLSGLSLATAALSIAYGCALFTGVFVARSFLRTL